MGICGSSLSLEEKYENQKNLELDKWGKKKQNDESKKLKLLLLGAGESGKSTVFKQMKILFSQQQGFTNDELIAGRDVVYSNILSNMQIVLKNCKENLTDIQDNVNDILALKNDAKIDNSIAEKLRTVWLHKAVQDLWSCRGSFQLQDTLEYFMLPENLDRVASRGYLPTNDDMLRSRVRTSGVVEAEYKIKDVTVAMFDVGGQRNERKKWIHCFDNVTAVIFVAAISEYDQVLDEDETTSRQDEALHLFKELCDSKWFKDKSMILFLNKRDLFKEKLTHIPFKVESGPNKRNVSYTGPVAVPGEKSSKIGTAEFQAVYDASARYLTQLYRSQSVDSMREIYVKLTCATDTNQVMVVMESCKDMILKNNLYQNGFL